MPHPRRPRLTWITTALALGVVATLIGGNLEITSRLRATRTGTTFTSPSGHISTLSVWSGSWLDHDSLNLAISGPAPLTYTYLDGPELRAVPHAAWRQMIREAVPACSKGTAFFNLQAWGIPFRSMAGGFAKGPPAQMEWYWNPKLGARTFTVPTRIIWPGFIANTLIAAALCWPLLAGAARALHTLRTRRLARRAQCQSCGYPRAGLTPAAACPECGASQGAPPSR